MDLDGVRNNDQKRILVKFVTIDVVLKIILYNARIAPNMKNNNVKEKLKKKEGILHFSTTEDIFLYICTPRISKFGT